MRKRRIVLFFIAVLLVAAGILLPDFRFYKPSSKTAPVAEDGIIFSITTFDGAAESEPFVKCMGHTWLSVDNRSGHSVYLNDCEIKDGECLTFSVWAISGCRGVAFNLEANFIREFDRYAGRESLSMPIEESQLQTIGEYIGNVRGWGLLQNCSYRSVQLWNALAPDELRLPTQTLLYTPGRLQKALREFDGVEIDRDFSRAGGAFFYRDGEKTEVELCA